MDWRTVFVGSRDTDPVWLRHGYTGCLKLVDTTTPGILSNPSGPPGEAWRHGWGVHHPGDNHAAVLNSAKAECDRLGLTSYGLDIEFGWFYDGDLNGWGPAHTEQEWAAWGPELNLLLTARELFGEEFPLWVCVLPYKDYGAGYFTAANTTVVPMLYGDAGPLPDAAEAWAWCQNAYVGSTLVPALWKGQPAPGLMQPCIRFLAEIMDETDYL